MTVTKKQEKRFTKLRISDAFKLSAIVGTFNDSRTRNDYIKLLMMMFWTCRSDRDMVTTAGAAQLSKLADVPRDKAKRFLRRGERDGWLVRVGTYTNNTGEYVCRKIVEPRGASSAKSWEERFDEEMDASIERMNRQWEERRKERMASM